MGRLFSKGHLNLPTDKEIKEFVKKNPGPWILQRVLRNFGPGRVAINRAVRLVKEIK